MRDTDGLQTTLTFRPVNRIDQTLSLDLSLEMSLPMPHQDEHLPDQIEAYVHQAGLEFQRRRDFLLPALERAGLTVPSPPTGAFYAYARCPGDGKRFALELLESEGVAATPGVDFGSNGTRRCVRFAYTQSMENLEEAARRLARFCRR